MRDDTKKFRIFTRRSFFAFGLQALFFTILSSRFYYLQVWDRQRYQTLSDSNRIRLSIVPPIRGEVYDQKGRLLIGNKLFYRIVIDSHKAVEVRASIDAINPYLQQPIHLTDTELASLLYQSSRYSPLVLSDNVGWEDIAVIESYSYKFPKVMIEQGSKRHYPAGSATSVITGYVAPPTEAELKQLGISNYQDFVIGKNGIERALDHNLRGQPGVRKTEVDVKGRVIRELTYERGINGAATTLTIDLELQEYIHHLLVGQDGAIVVLDADSGAVLALYSAPSYDANLFIGGISQHDWNQLSTNPHKPLINKCISAVYPPGSTFKMVTALAALENGVPPDFSVKCTGEYNVGQHVFHCWKRTGHGTMNMDEALAQSCNPYFYRIAERIGIRHIAKMANILGLGSPTGIELPFESSGLIPDRPWKEMRYRQEWMRGDTTNTAIGQGYVLVTILQLAVMLARIASGQALTPALQSNALLERNIRKIAIRPESLEVVRHGIYAAFNEPYGKNYGSRLHLPGFEMCGKSGTAQIASLANSKKRGLIDHGLFVGFAPYNQPRYIVASIIEHGGWGSASAMPVVRSIMQYLHQRL